MKLQIQFKAVLVLLLTPLLLIAHSGASTIKTEKTKIIKKSFNVGSNATLQVVNSFGNIQVITWDENRIEFDISITVSGNNSEKVEERLNGINIKFSSNPTLVSAITKIADNRKNWWNWGKKMNLKMEIDYIIKIPMTNNIDLSNKFGAITLDKLKGSTKIRCDHGNITTKALLSNSNDIEFNHTQDNYFDYIESADISATHSDFTIAKVENLKLNAAHTKSVIEISENIDFKCAHGSLKVDYVNNIKGNSQHLNTRIGTLFKDANLETSHGSLKISKLESKARTIVIESQFTGISIGYDKALNFDFDFDIAFGSLRDAEGLNFTNRDTRLHNKRYIGFYGSQDSETHVNINSKHGSVSFKQLY